MFRIKNLNSHIKYYTFVIDNDQVKENRDDSLIIERSRQPSKKIFSRQIEKFVFDREAGEWRSELSYV